MVSTVLVCTPSPVAGQIFELADYLALQPGTWDYVTNNSATPRMTATGSGFVRNINFITFGGDLASTFSLTEAGLVFVKDDSTVAGEPYVETQNSAIVVIPAQLTVGGSSFSSSGSYTGVEPGDTYMGTNTFTTTANGLENVTVPAGTFSALKVTVVSNWSDEDESGVTTQVIWLAEGRGIVKMNYNAIADGELQFFGEFGLTSSPPRPATPTGVTATDGTEVGQVTISWSSVSGRDEYLISRSTEASPATATLLATTNSTTFTDTTVEGDTTYYYFVRSRIGGANSEFSSPDSGQAATVAPVTPVVNIGRVSHEIELRWLSQVGVKYQIQNSTTLRDWKPTEPTPRDGTGGELLFKSGFGATPPDFIYYRVIIAE